MLESEQNANSIQERKAKIRKRYEGIDQSRIKTIPAKPVKGLYEETETIRVGVYARVSTDDPNQTSSYELQKIYYEDMSNNLSSIKLCMEQLRSLQIILQKMDGRWGSGLIE